LIPSRFLFRHHKIYSVLKVSLRNLRKSPGVTTNKWSSSDGHLYLKGVFMPRKYGPGGFGDQYDNQSMKSIDRDQHPGSVTGIHLEEDFDQNSMDFNPLHGEAYLEQDGSRDDEKLNERVFEVLLQSHEVDPSEVEIDVQEGSVYL